MQEFIESCQAGNDAGLPYEQWYFRRSSSPQAREQQSRLDLFPCSFGD